MEKARDLGWFRTLGVIFIGGSVQDPSVAIDDVGRGNWQLPTLVTVGKGQVDESAAVNGFLQRRHAIRQSKLTRYFIASVGEKRKAELMLVVHEERLFHGLR